MQRLLSINSYHYRRGGADAVYLDHARLFGERGWENQFFSMEHPRNIATADPVTLTSMVDYEFSTTGKAKAITALKSIYNIEASRKIDHLLQDFRPDIAHVHGAYHHLTPAIFPRLSSRGIPIVLTAHDFKILCPAYTMYRNGMVCEACKGGQKWNVVRNRCIKGGLAASLVVGFEAGLHGLLNSYRKHVSMVIAPSEFYRAKFLEWGWPAERIEHIPNYTNSISAEHDGAYSEPILYFGRLSAEKGLETLVQAAAAAKVPVNIVGSGPMAEPLQMLIDALDAPVRLVGRLEGAALWRALGRSKATVLPSEWYENGPISVLESFELARPVIGADIGGIPEMLTQSGGGWLFESGNVTALADLLAHVDGLGVSALQEKGVAGRDHARRFHTEDAYFAKMAGVYQRLKGCVT